MSVMYKFVFVLLYTLFSFQQQESSAVPNDYDLSDVQYADWKSIKNNWMMSEYEKIKAEQNINLNCKSCSSFFIEVELTIGKNGKLESYKLLSGKKCAFSVSKELELRMMRNFYKFEFPASLRNITFKSKLGDSLKC